MKNLIVAAAAASLLLAPAAFAKKGGKASVQNHHCMKDGAEMAGKTHKQCTKSGGKWEKMSSMDAAPAATPTK